MMLDYSQRDYRWANKKIGASQLTIGRYGCTITCIADLSTYFGDNMTPAEVADKLQFTKDGLIIWSSVNFEHFKFSQRLYTHSPILERAALFDPNQAVILQVHNGSHWVVLTGLLQQGKDYQIADPWLGDRSSLIQRYENITGAAYFRRK